MFFWRNDVDGLRRAFTDRSGGVSTGVYAGLNLGGHVGDAPDAVWENRLRIADEVGVHLDRLVFMDQCHGADVAVISDKPEGPLVVDGVVTAEPDLALAVLVAGVISRDVGLYAAILLVIVFTLNLASRGLVHLVKSDLEEGTA